MNFWSIIIQKYALVTLFFKVLALSPSTWKLALHMFLALLKIAPSNFNVTMPTTLY